MRHLTIALLIVTTTSPAAADSFDGGGEIRPDDDGATLVVGIEYTSDGSPSLPAASAQLPSPIQRIWIADNATEQGLAPLCDAGNGNGIFSGWWYRVVTQSRNGTVLGNAAVCVPLPDPNDISPPPPPELADPPTIGEIWSAVASANIPRPDIGVSPHTEGVTGLETWLWATAPGADTITVNASTGEWTVTGSATRTGFTFDFGEGPAEAASTGGTEAQPAAHHVYETKGTYDVRVTSAWTAEFLLSGPGIDDPIPVDIGTAHLTSTRDYRVVEIRATLTR